MGDHGMETVLCIKGGGTQEERVLMLKETARLKRWEILGKSASTVAFFAMVALTCPVICIPGCFFDSEAVGESSSSGTGTTSSPVITTDGNTSVIPPSDSESSDGLADTTSSSAASSTSSVDQGSSSSTIGESSSSTTTSSVSEPYAPCSPEDPCTGDGVVCIWTDGVVEKISPTGFCSQGCNEPADCPAAPAGSDAELACTYYCDVLHCQLRCPDGETCPEGTQCIPLMELPKCAGTFVDVCA